MTNQRHPRACGDPEKYRKRWIPAYAGMTRWEAGMTKGGGIFSLLLTASVFIDYNKIILYSIMWQTPLFEH